MPFPAWLLLFWSGLAATCAAALLGSLLGGRAPVSWAVVPRGRPASAVVASIAAGLVLYPIVYGVAFETLASARATTGLALGSVHGLLAFLLARTSLPTRAAVRTGIMHVLYGVVIGFLYVTP